MSSGPSNSSAAPASVLRFLMQGRSASTRTAQELTEAERQQATKLVWEAPADLAEPPGPEKVLPQLEAPGIRIECVGRRPIDTLAERVQVCRERQLEQGRMLASTFCHGGSLFLVFKHWPHSASPFPRST